MTSVSSLGAYQYSAKNYSSLDRNGDGIVSADEIQASAKSGNGISSLGSDQEDSGAAGGAATNQLLTMLVNMIMNLSSGQSSGSSDSSGGNSPGSADRLAELDTDGDGSLSASEFLAGRPEDVSEDMATNLFTQLDTDGDGVVSSEEFSAMAPPKGPRPGSAGGPDARDSADMLADLDTDGDGSLSVSEFLVGRPEDVSEDMATNLFTQLDTDGDGVVSSDELSAMTPLKGPPPPDISAGRTGEDDQSTESATAIEDLLSRLEEIAKAYMAFNTNEAATQSITA